MWALLSPAQHRAAIVLLVLMVFGMGLEMLGVGLVVPTVALLTSPDVGGRFPAIRPVLEFLGNPSQQDLVLGGMFFLAGIFLFKAVFMGAVIWRQMAFSFGVQADLSQRLFSVYLRQPYTFHLQRNSAQLIQNATTEVSSFTFNVMLPVMMLLTEGLVLCGFAALLLVVEPLGAVIVASALGTASWAFYYFTRQRVARWGQDRQLHEGLRIQHLQQGLGGAKDVKLLGREEEFLRRYSLHNARSAHVARLQLALQQLPRLWLEVLAVTGLALLVMTMLALGRPLETLLPILGLFAAAAFRLMPSINRLLNAVQSLRFGHPVINLLHAELTGLDFATPQVGERSGAFADCIELVRVGYTYSGAAQPAVSDISLRIRRGECVGFVGTSGAGKSTLVDVLLGLLKPTAGAVRCDGRDIRTGLRAWQDQIGYVPQSIFLTDDSLRRNIAFGLPDDRIDDAAVERALHAAQLHEFVRTLPEGLQTVVGERGVRLSGGQRQRIGIARALYHDPAVLVLDEATSSLDSATERGVMEAVKALQGEKTIVIVAHRLSTVSDCDRLYRLEHGRVVADGSYREIVGSMASPDLQGAG